ncbi:unconventional myosin-XV-like [Callithrix jacchus]
MRFHEQHREDGVEDTTQLEDLQETTVLSNLKIRFEQNLIYIGPGAPLPWAWVRKAAASWGRVGCTDFFLDPSPWGLWFELLSFVNSA